MRRWLYLGLFLPLLLTPLVASAQEAAVDPPAAAPEQPATPAPPRRPPSAPT